MQQRKRYGTLTAAQAHAWDQSKARTGIGELGALAYMEDSPMTAPQRQGRLKRAHKKGKRQHPLEHHNSDWTVAAIDAVVAEAGAPLLNAEVAASVDCSDMVLLGQRAWEYGDKERCVYVVASLTCLRMMEKLDNPSCIKLCADATFKHTFGGWCIAPIGTLTKHYGMTTPRGTCGAPVKAWATYRYP